MPFHLRTVGISLAALGGLYAVILGALLTPDLQRLYVLSRGNVSGIELINAAPYTLTNSTPYSYTT